MLTKRQYAYWKTMEETLRLIADNGNDLKVTNAYKTAQANAEAARKVLANFAGTTPAWTPDDNRRNYYRKATVQAPAQNN